MSDLQQIYSDVNTNPLVSPRVAPQQFGQTPTIPKSSGLPGALNTSMQPNIAPVKKALPPVSTNLTPSNNVIPSTENLVSEEMKIGSQLTTANEKLARATAAQADAQAEGKAQVIQEYADKTHEAVDQKAKQLAKWEYPEMHPTETNIKELGGLFSVMSVIGLMLGGSGKLGAMNALGAMSGMMKGWQEGKQDLFKREKEKFDARFAEVKQIHADIENNFNEYMKLLSTDKEAAMYAREELVRKTGSSGILSAQIEKGQLEAAAATIKSIKTSIEHIEKRTDDRRKEANADRRFKLEYDQRERLAQVRAASGGRGSALNTRYAFNMAEAFAQASTDLVNVTKLPAGTMMGTFAELAGQSPDSITTSLSTLFARNLTDQDKRMFAQLVAGLDQNMARVLGGGYASSTAKGMVEAYKQQVAREGDTPANEALFLARFKQELDIFADVYEAHPGATDKMIAGIKKAREAHDKAIPFDVDQVIKAANQGRITLGKDLQDFALSPTVGDLPVDNTPQGMSYPLPTQSDIDYVNKYPEHIADFRKQFGRDP
jgi:hypothetical protein